MLLVLARWPVMLWAVVDAVVATVMRRDFSFGVTFKGTGPGRPLAWRTLLPQYVIILVSLGTVEWYLLAFTGVHLAEGYIMLALINAAIYVVYTLLVTLLHWHDARRAQVRGPLRGISLKLATGVVAMALTIAVVVNTFPLISHSVVGGVLASPQQSSGQIAPNLPADSGAIPRRLPIVPPPQRPFFGAYDPQGLLTTTPGVQVDEYFINWTQNALGQDVDIQIVIDVRASQARGHFPLLTIEPWASPAEDKTPVLADIVAGRHRLQEDRIVAALRAVAPQQVYIRFMHEMDLKGPYPWQTKNTQLFIAAFRQFVTYLRHNGVSNAQFMWSPAYLLTPELDYYPGGDVVDVIGISMFFYLPQAAFPQQPVQDRLVEHLRLASLLKRPLIIAEFGMHGQAQAQILTIIGDARAAAKHLHGLLGIVYYDALNAPVWSGPVDYSWKMSNKSAWLFFTGALPPTIHRTEPPD